VSGVHQVWRVPERPEFAGPLLLDTHVWFWMLTGDLGRMHPGVAALLDRAARIGALHVSDISCWEIVQKTVAGRLSLSLPVETWLDRAVRAPGVTMLSLDRPSLMLGAQLEGMQGDPVDRWIVATAKLGGFTLLTADAATLAFGRRERLTMMVDGRR
jgi:PIN domain nuclease of toxin-antitoxin system